MDIQTVTLLATIIALTSNLLSINEKLSKVGILTTIKTLSICILPFLFIQQIIQITYYNKKFFSIITLIIGILGIVRVCYNKFYKKIRIFSETDCCILLSMITANIMFFFQFVIINSSIENYDFLIANFIEQLNTYKISSELYIYLSNNLFCTIAILIDCTSMILLFLTNVYSIENFKDYFFEINFDTHITWNYKKYAISVLYCLFFTIGLIKMALKGIIQLF